MLNSFKEEIGFNNIFFHLPGFGKTSSQIQCSIKSMEGKEKKVSAKKVIITSFLVDFLDIFLSFIVAIHSGSVVMLTQVLEGVSDLSSSGLLLIGLKKSGRKADRTHPFGYGREIYFWTLLAALIMFGFTSTISIYFGWKRVITPEPP